MDAVLVSGMGCKEEGLEAVKFQQEDHKNGYFYIDDSFGEFPRSCVMPIGDFFNSISRNDFFQGMEFYVIGNIHDNKELLKDI